MLIDGESTLAEKFEYIKRYSPESYRHLAGLIDGLVKQLKLNGSPHKGPPKIKA